jgi:hypothetical protein
MSIRRILRWVPAQRRAVSAMAVGALVSSPLWVGGAVTQAAAATAPSAGKGHALVWSLARDFRVAPHQANPSPDRYGNPAVWSYQESAGDAHDPATYSPLSAFEPAEVNVPGLEAWAGPDCAELNNCFPRVGINATGVDQSLNGGTILWPAGAALLHPDVTHMAVVGWTSPVRGHVKMSGTFQLIGNPTCGNGIQWSIDSGSTILAEGRVTPSHTNASFRLDSHVKTGQTFYLTINSYHHDYVCDSTLTAWRIKRHGRTGR